MQLSTTPLAGKQAEVFRNSRRNTLAIYKELCRERKEEGAPTGQWALLWEQLQCDGGTTLYAEPTDRAVALQKALDQAGQGRSVAAGGHAPRRLQGRAGPGNQPPRGGQHRQEHQGVLQLYAPTRIAFKYKLPLQHTLEIQGLGSLVSWLAGDNVGMFTHK